MQNQKTDTKIELKWYEKKQGVKLSQKKKKVEGKLLRKEKRAHESDEISAKKTDTISSPKHAPSTALVADVVSSLFNPASLPNDSVPVITKSLF